MSLFCITIEIISVMPLFDMILYVHRSLVVAAVDLILTYHIGLPCITTKGLLFVIIVVQCYMVYFVKVYNVKVRSIINSILIVA